MGDRCNWKGCREKGTHDQTDRDGRVWSVLCLRHHNELDAAITSLNVKKMMRAWVLASGGPEKMVKG